MREATKKEIDNFIKYRSLHIALVERLGKLAFNEDYSNHDFDKCTANKKDLAVYAIRNAYLNKECEPSEEELKEIGKLPGKHIKNNRHHPEYWDIEITERNWDDNNPTPCTPHKMPDRYIREMACDWSAVSLKKNAPIFAWFNKTCIGENKRFDFTERQLEYLKDCLKQVEKVIVKNNITYPGLKYDAEQVEPLKESKEDNFKKWFGDSKVVNEDGSPKVVYHTQSDWDYYHHNKQELPIKFNTFDNKYSKYGFFFTDNKKFRDVWAKEFYQNNDSNYKYDCYLKIENPLEINCNNSNFESIPLKYITSVFDKIENKKDSKLSKDFIKFCFNENGYKENYETEEEAILNFTYEYNTYTDEICEFIVSSKLLNSKIDGIIFSNIIEDYVININDSITEYIVFNPNQIKSVNNNGNFSTESNNIYESLKLEEADRSRFINPNPNLTPEQKEELISLFKKFTTLGGNIKWGSKEVNNWTYEQFLPYIQASKQSKNQSFKNGLEGLVQGEDYEVIGKYDDGTISYAIFDYKASVVIASNQVEPQVFTPLPHWAFTDEVKDLKVFPFGKPENPSCDLDRSVNPPRIVKEFAERDTIFPGAKWCTAMQTSDGHWNEYTQHKIKLAYICSPSQEEMKWKKTALVKYDRNTSWGDDAELYDSFDNSHAPEEYPNQQVIEDIISWMKNHKVPKQDLVKSGFLVLDEKTGLYNNTVEKHINDMWDQLFDYDENGNRTARYKIGTWKGTWSCKDNTCKDSPRVVQGRFMASMLTSLEGCPYIVGGDFDITASMLNNLVGGPVAVSGNYYCTRCHLKSLDGAPLTTSHTFDCSDNDLITLEGAPKQVGGGFFCENNENLKSLKGCPESIDSNLLLRGCKNLESIEGIAHRVGGFIDLSDCKKIKNRNLPENCKAKEGVYWPWTDEEISDTMDNITKMSDEEIHDLLKTNESKIKEHKLSNNQEIFFKNSKCRDKNGNLIICYHGSPNDFDTFSKKKIGSSTDYGLFGPGFYFTDNKEKAEGWGENSNSKNYHIYKVYLNMINPYIIDSKKSEDDYFEIYGKGMAEAAKKDGFNPEKDNLTECDGPNLQKCRKENLDRFLSKYDGIIQTYVPDYPGNDKDFHQYVVYEPNQIKFITNQNPTSKNSMKESKITESEDITQSENFKKWFKNSKIVDKNGNPLLVYHGTPKGKFDVFKNRDNLFYFTDKKEHAEWMGNWTDNDDVTVYSCYLSIQNPKIIDADENWWGDIYGDSEDFEDGTSTRDFAMAAKYEGYDGAIIYNVFEGGDGEILTNTYVAFSSNQIKSIDNNGDFSMESDNIYEKVDKPIMIEGVSADDKDQILKFGDLIHNHGLEHHDLPGHECWSGLKEKAGDIYIVTDMTGRRIQNTESDDVNKVKEIRNFLAKKYNEIFKIMKLSSQTENIELSEYKLTEDGECGGCVGGGESVSSGCNFSSNFTGFAPEKVNKKIILNSNLSDFDTEAKKVLKESILDIPHKEYCKDVLTEDDRLQTEVRKQIVNTVKKWKKQINFNFKVTGLYAKGSLLTKRYNDDTDLDVSIYTNMTQEQLDEIYDIIPKGQNITGTNHPLDFYVLIDGEETNEKNLDNIYDVAKDKWIKRTEEYSNELPLEYVMQTCNFFINGCVIALNNYENDKILYNYYKNLSSENYELSNDELIEILSDKKKDLLSDLDGLRMATHMISSFRQEAYDDEPIPFGVSIEVLNDNVHVTLNEQLAKLLEKFAIRDKLRDAIKECETLLGLDKEEGTI